MIIIVSRIFMMFYSCGDCYLSEGYGHLDILRVLLARGADIGWKDKNGQNSLQGTSHEESIFLPVIRQIVRSHGSH